MALVCFENTSSSRLPGAVAVAASNASFLLTTSRRVNVLTIFLAYDTPCSLLLSPLKMFDVQGSFILVLCEDCDVV